MTPRAMLVGGSAAAAGLIVTSGLTVADALDGAEHDAASGWFATHAAVLVAAVLSAGIAAWLVALRGDLHQRRPLRVAIAVSLLTYPLFALLFAVGVLVAHVRDGSFTAEYALQEMIWIPLSSLAAMTYAFVLTIVPAFAAQYLVARIARRADA